MYIFSCNPWPYLVGGLIAWLLAGWFARRLKYREPPEEVIIEKEIEIEKIIDNPEHLSLISSLKSENETIGRLRSRITELEDTPPKVVEKKVEVEKLVDNPAHLSLISSLKSENETIGGLRNRISELENTSAEVVEKTVEVEKLVDNPQHVRKIQDLEGEINIWKRGQSIDVPAARAAGISISKEDDFTAIEGIGPKINDLIHADGTHTFKQLSETKSSHIQQILDKAGANYQIANPGTWPDQAHLAASNRWPALKALQDILDGGVYPDPSSAGSEGGGSAGGSNSQYIARISKLEGELESYRNASDNSASTRESVADLNSAKAAGFKLRLKDGRDDFTIVEGIGPKINDLIHADGIHIYSELARAEIFRIQKILDDAGPNFKLAQPDTWPAQSDLAAKNEWEALKKWQDELDGGKE